MTMGASKLELVPVALAATMVYQRAYGMPPPEFYSGAPGLQSVVIVPLGTEIVTPLCAPELAAEIHTPRDLLSMTLIESDNKKVRWTDWFTVKIDTRLILGVVSNGAMDS